MQLQDDQQQAGMTITLNIVCMEVLMLWKSGTIAPQLSRPST
jgi:hypothetical protein